MLNDKLNIKAVHNSIITFVHVFEDTVLNPYLEGSSIDNIERALSGCLNDGFNNILQMVARQGLAQEFDGAFRKILDNNMSKVCNTEEDADKTVAMYTKKRYRMF